MLQEGYWRICCGAKEFEHEAEYLAEIAAKVYLFTPYADCGVRRENVILNPGKLQAILGDSAAEGVELRDGTRLDVDGVFVIRPPLLPADSSGAWKSTGRTLWSTGGWRPTSPAVMPPATAPAGPTS